MAVENGSPKRALIVTLIVTRSGHSHSNSKRTVRVKHSGPSKKALAEGIFRRL